MPSAERFDARTKSSCRELVTQDRGSFGEQAPNDQRIHVARSRKARSSEVGEQLRRFGCPPRLGEEQRQHAPPGQVPRHCQEHPRRELLDGSELTSVERAHRALYEEYQARNGVFARDPEVECLSCDALRVVEATVEQRQRDVVASRKRFVDRVIEACRDLLKLRDGSIGRGPLAAREVVGDAPGARCIGEQRVTHRMGDGQCFVGEPFEIVQRFVRGRAPTARTQSAD
ncbi:MAG: hypothetical protein U0263_13875 [Polyangiaceae bacterium]